MKKIVILLLFLLVFIGRAPAFGQVSADSISAILQRRESPMQHKKLVLSLRYYFSGRPLDSLTSAKRQLDGLLSRYQVNNVKAINYFVQTLYLMGLRQYAQAEGELVRAIDMAEYADDHYLLFACFTQLGFLQNLKGNTTEAVRSFRQARQEAIKLNDAYLQVLIDVNIADIYLRNTLYNQSLVYLNQSQALIAKQHMNEPVFVMMIYVNKAENYFNLGNTDSLSKYCNELFAMKLQDSRLHTFQQHSLYNLELLHGQYKQALAHLASLKKDPRYNFDETDEQNLANALYRDGQTDSARKIARRLIQDEAQKNHPEATLPLYEMLARIAAGKGEKDLAIQRFDQSLQQAKTQLLRLKEVDTIAARLKIDEMQGNYIRQEEAFKRDRLLLLFSFITVSILLIAGAVLYRNIRQKRQLEKLLFEAKKNELSFINSHQVRRHLSNILGIIDIISHGDDSYEAYLEGKSHLLSAAEDLDNSIREISEKLNG